jgi:hypothetical protein
MALWLLCNCGSAAGTEQMAAKADSPAAHRLSLLRKFPKPIKAVAWDVDHTIVRYHLKELMKLVYEGLRNFLVERCGMAWAKPFVDAPYDYDFVQRGLVFEFDRGNTLKLGADGTVFRACHGTRLLSPTELATEYPARWMHFDELVRRSRHPSFVVFLTWFDAPACLLMARLVDAIDSGEAKSLPAVDPSGETAASHTGIALEDASPMAAPVTGAGYSWLWPLMIRAFDELFNNIDGFHKARGSFFESLTSRPETILYPRPRLAKALASLKARGVRQILATNSHFRFADFCLRAALGDDYRELFDLVVVSCIKGAWFSSPSALDDGRPFHTMCDAGWRDGGIATTLTLGPLGPSTSEDDGRDAIDRPMPEGDGRTTIEDELWPRLDPALAKLSGQVDEKSRMEVSKTVYVRGNATDVVRVLHAAEFARAGSALSVSLSADGPREEAEPSVSFRAESLVDGTEAPVDARSAIPDAWEQHLLYVGDHPHGDIVAASADARWLSCAVVEELQNAGDGWELGGQESSQGFGRVHDDGAEVPGACSRLWGPALETVSGARSHLADVVAEHSHVMSNDATCVAEWLVALTESSLV